MVVGYASVSPSKKGNFFRPDIQAPDASKASGAFLFGTIRGRAVMLNSFQHPLQIHNNKTKKTTWQED